MGGAFFCEEAEVEKVIDFYCTFFFLKISCHDAEKAMAPHSSTLVWKVPWTEEPGRLQSMGLRRVGHD